MNIWTGLISSEQQFCGDIKLERGEEEQPEENPLQASLISSVTTGSCTTRWTSSIESLLQFCEPSIIINLDIWNSSFFSEVLSCLTISQDGPRPKHNRRNSGTRCFFKQFCIKVLKDGDRKEVYRLWKCQRQVRGELQDRPGNKVNDCCLFHN